MQGLLRVGQRYKRHWRFPEQIVRRTDHRDLVNSRVLGDDVLDLAGADTMGPDFDHVVATADEIEKALGVRITEIASVITEAVESPRGFGGIVPVAARDIGAAGHEFANLAG